MDSVELSRAIIEHFNKDEINTLCFELNIKFEDLPAPTQSGLARELVLYCERSGQIDELKRVCQDHRPNVEWIQPETAAAAPLKGLAYYDVADARLLNKQEREFVEVSQLAEAAREQEKKTARRNQEVVLIVEWILATTLGSIVVFAVLRLGVDVYGVYGAVSYALVGVMVGAVVGLLQWFFVLRREVPKAGWWVLATTLGFGMGFAATFSDAAVFLYGALGYALGGAIAGLLQWFFVLRREVPKAGWWVLATTLGSFVGLFVSLIASSGAGITITFFVGSYVVVSGLVGLITGSVLIWLLRQRE